MKFPFIVIFCLVFVGISSAGTFVIGPSWDGVVYNNTANNSWSNAVQLAGSSVTTTGEGMYLARVATSATTGSGLFGGTYEGYAVFNMTTFYPVVNVTNVSYTFYVSSATPPRTGLGDTDVIFSGARIYSNRGNAIVWDKIRIHKTYFGNFTVSGAVGGQLNTVYFNQEGRTYLTQSSAYPALFSRMAWELDDPVTFGGTWAQLENTSVYIGTMDNSIPENRPSLTIEFDNGTYETDHYNITVGNDFVYVYDVPGNYTFTPQSGVNSVNVLVQAGGGGGGGFGDYQAGGGGAAGGLKTNDSYPVTPGTPVNLRVGDGGDGAVYNVQSGRRGGNSTFGTIDAHGGGGGVLNLISGAVIERDGGNGAGGGGRGNTTAGISDDGLGYPGSAGSSSNTYPAGGGGGTAEAGGTAVPSGWAGYGGNGTQSTILGNPIWFGGGAGGGVYSGANAGNGSYYGGGGAGCGFAVNTNTVGRDGLGSGGGGGGYHVTGANGMKGGRGVVIVRFTPGGADTTPPASITGLANSTTCNSINFTWTNPGGDQNETVIFKDGVLYKNVSNTTTFDLWEGLNGWRTYQFDAKTKDIAGNLNATNVSMTVQTSPICIIEGILRNWFWRLPTEMMR
jgi:hypothetical protein